MKKKRGMTSKEKIELYFRCIIERQELEKKYYQTHDQELLVEIEKARERIKEVMKMM